MLDEIRYATSDDFDAVWSFYADVCAQMPHDQYNPRWELGVFPTERKIHYLIDEDTMLLGMIDGDIRAAFSLIPHDDDEYEGVDWPSDAAGDEVAVIGLLAVHPTVRGKGIGAELVQEAIRRSRDQGKRVIRLDVVADNLAASRIYRETGFKHVADFEDYYERTGRMDFELYELEL